MVLVTHPAATSIPSDIAAIEQRASSLVNVDLESALRIATAALNIGGIRGGHYLDGFAAGVKSKPDIIPALPSSLRFDLLKRFPLLLASRESVARPIEYQLAVAGYISSLNVTEELSREITKAVLSANAWAALAIILTRFGNDAVSAILEWIDAMPEVSLSIPQQVFDSLAAQRHSVTDVIHRRRFGARAFARGICVPRPTCRRGSGTRNESMGNASRKRDTVGIG